jgi:hypothetical protein
MHVPLPLREGSEVGKAASQLKQGTAYHPAAWFNSPFAAHQSLLQLPACRSRVLAYGVHQEACLPCHTLYERGRLPGVSATDVRHRLRMKALHLPRFRPPAVRLHRGRPLPVTRLPRGVLLPPPGEERLSEGNPVHEIPEKAAALVPVPDGNKYPPAQPGVLRLLPP